MTENVSAHFIISPMSLYDVHLLAKLRFGCDSLVQNGCSMAVKHQALPECLQI